METMRSVVRRGPRTVALVDVPAPELEPGTALVRVRACGVCGSDLHAYRRGDTQQEPGYWWGHELAGEVVAISPHPGERPRIQEGDLVASDPVLGHACGACRWCQEGAPVHCLNKRDGAGWTGGYSSYVKRDVRGLFPLPPSVGPDDGALAEPLAVGVHALRLAGLRPGASVAVLGAGTIGLATLAAAQALGAASVFISARHPHQMALARELAATAVLPEDPAEAETAVRDLTGGEGVDLVVETVGGAATTVDTALTLVRRRGTVAVLGLFEHAVPLSTGKAFNREVTLQFPLCYGAQDGRHDFEVAIDLLAAQRESLSRLVSHRFALDEATAAFGTADDKSTCSVKVLVNP